MTLKALGNGISERYQIGKGDIDKNVIAMLDKALTSKELIKVSLLQNSPKTAKEAGEVLSKELKAEVVQCIGRIVLLYRANPKHPKIVI